METIVFPKRILITILSNFARDLGLKEYLAVVSGELFVERNKESLNCLSEFNYNNCNDCKFNPNNCDFFFPKKVIGATKLEVFMMNVNMIATGKQKTCPVKDLHKGEDE